MKRNFAFNDIFLCSLDIPSLLENPVVVKIAKKHNKTPAQVLLRNVVQKGIAAIPKSTNPERIKQNIDVRLRVYFNYLNIFFKYYFNFQIFNFQLDADDIKQLEALDRNEKILLLQKIFKG